MLVEMENMLKKEDMNVMFTDRFIFTQRSRISTQLEEFKKGNLIWLGWVAASLKRKGTDETLKTTLMYFDPNNRLGSIWSSE